MNKLLLLLLFLLPTNCFAAVTFNGGVTTTNLGCGTSDDILTENGAFTISAWIKPVSTATNASPRIISRTAGSTASISFGVVSASGNTIQFTIGGSTTLNRTGNGGSIALNTWQHVLVKGDGSTTAVNYNIYVNGTEVGYQTSNDGVTPSDTAGLTTEIGNRANSSDRAFLGQIQDVHIWNKALTASEIAQDYNGGKQGVNALTIAPDALIRWWRLNECADGIVCSGSNQFKDLSASAVSCTAGGSPKGSAPVYSQITGGTLYGATIY